MDANEELAEVVRTLVVGAGVVACAYWVWLYAAELVRFVGFLF